MIWTWPIHFGRDNFIMVKSKSIWSDQNQFFRPKPFWTDQNCFGHIERQGINVTIRNLRDHQDNVTECQLSMGTLKKSRACVKLVRPYIHVIYMNTRFWDCGLDQKCCLPWNNHVVFLCRNFFQLIRTLSRRQRGSEGTTLYVLLVLFCYYHPRYWRTV